MSRRPRGERSRLAANLHDTLLQSLAGVLLQLDALRQSFLRRDLEDADGQLDVAKRMVRRAVVDLRCSVWALRTAPLAGRSVVESREAIATHLGDGQGADIEPRVAGPAFEPPRFVAGSLLLAVQEALRNALNHGRPTTVKVLIDYGADGRAPLSPASLVNSTGAFAAVRQRALWRHRRRLAQSLYPA